MANKTPDYQLQAVKKYKSKFHEVKVNFLPEEYEAVVAHAKKARDKSASAFIKRAVNETMERESTAQPTDE